MNTTRFAVLVCLATSLSACATSRAPAETTRSSLRTISGTDISAAGGTSAYDGVRLLNPPFMSGRAAPSLVDSRVDLPIAYVDRIRIWDLEALRFVSSADIRSMQYLDPSSATIRFGTNHRGGAILVATHQGR